MSAPVHADRFDLLPPERILSAFGARTGDGLALDELDQFAVALGERSTGPWSILPVLPGGEWLCAAIRAADDPNDWVEIAVSVRSWRDPDVEDERPLRFWQIEVALEVACWCDRNHNIHRVQEHVLEAGSPAGVGRACATVLPMIDTRLAQGLLPADGWRSQAGLPPRAS